MNSNELVDNADLEEQEETLDIQDIRGVDAKPSSKASPSSGSEIRIINTERHGKRIVIKSSIVEYLETDEIDIGFTEKNMILAPRGTGICEEAFKLKSYGNQYVIYNSQLVEEITEFFELNFDNTTTNGLRTQKTMLSEEIKVVLVGIEIETV